MKRLLYIACILFLPALASAQAGTFTFECICDYVTAADSNCDICSSTIQSRLFCGVLVRKNNVAYKWIDAPYIVKVQGQTVVLQEIIPNAEMVSINLAGTDFGTIDSLKMAVDCPCGVFNDPLFYATDSTNIAPVYLGDTIAIVGRNLAQVSFDSLLKKWVINVDSISGGGSGTVTSVDATEPAEGFTISGGPITTSGTFLFTLADDLAAVEALTGTGIAVRTGTSTWTTRSIIAGAGISVTNPDGVSGNIEINATNNKYQTWYDNGVIETQRERANFLNSVDIGLALTDDAINGETEVTADILTNAVDDSELRQSAGLSVIGRSTSTTGNVADITAGTDAFVLRRSGTTLGFGQVATGGIADAAVTYAKIQNVTASRLLGRGSAAGNGPPVEITAGTGLSFSGTTLNATATGTVGGTGVANRIAWWLDANNITSDAAFVVDGTNDRMTITGSVAGSGSNNAFLNLNGGSITGTVEALRASVNASTSLDAVIANARNIGNTGNAKLELEVGGTSAGDPFTLYSIPSGVDFAVGLDNSDSDKFKVTPGGTSPGSTANSGLIVTNNSPPRVGVNLDAPTHPLDVNGVARAEQFRMTGNEYTSANIVFGTGAGTGPSLGSISGGNNGLQVNFNTGTAPVAGGVVFTITYPLAYNSNTYPVMFARSNPGGQNTAANIDILYVDIAGNASFSLRLTPGNTLPANTQFAMSFGIQGY